MFAYQPISGPIWMPGGEALAHLGPLWALVGTIVAVLIAAIAVGRNWRVSGAIATLGAALTAYLAYRGFRDAGFTNWAGLAPDGAAPMLVADQFSYFFIGLLAVFAILVTGMWWFGQNAGLPEELTRKQDSAEFFVLFLGSAFGMSLMVSTTNLLMIILAVEMASLPSYAVTGFRKRHRLAAEASMKYVLFGAITSAIMIYGASLLYGQYHTLDLAAIGTAIADESGPTLLMGVSLFAFMVGIAFKISAVPFHFWCPDVFEGASIEITTWLSVASKAAGLGLMLRVITVLTCHIPTPDVTLQYVSQAVAVMAAITCTVGNLSAFRQTNMKRLLAYSSIAHAGYMLMAAAIIWRPEAIHAGDAAHPAFSALAFYVVIYVLMNFGAFGVVALVYWTTGKETIDAFSGLVRRSPLLALAMTICLFSLIGLPPMGGFLAKWWLLVALWEGKLVWLILVAVFNTLISLYYYVRVIKAMMLEDDGQPAIRTPLLGQAAVGACAILILLTGTLWAGGLKGFSDRRSQGLYAVVKPSDAAAETDDGHEGPVAVGPRTGRP